jgi:hypothetical protein
MLAATCSHGTQLSTVVTMLILHQHVVVLFCYVIFLQGDVSGWWAVD